MFEKIGFSYIIVFLFVGTIFLISTATVYEIGEEKILNQTVKNLQSIAESNNIDQTSKDIINNIERDFSSTYIPYDLGYVALFISAIIGSFTLAYKSPPLGTFNFLGVMTFGLIFFLFMVGIVDLTTDWILDNVIFGFLEFDLSSKAPLISFIFDNLGMVSFVWALCLILINRFSLDIREQSFSDGGFEQ